MVQENHRAPGPAEFLQEQNLVGILPGQPIRAEHGDGRNRAIAHGIAQAIKAGSIQPRTADAGVAIDVLLGDLVAVGLCPNPQGGELTVDGLIAALAFGGDMG